MTVTNANSRASGWYYAEWRGPDRQATGPFTWEQFYALAQAGTLTPDDLVWHEACPDWLPAAQVAGLFPTAASPAVQAPYRAPGQAEAVYAPAAQPAAAHAAGPRRSWLYWAVPLFVLILAGAGLGAYFGFVRGDGGDSSTVSSHTTTVVSETTSTARTTTTAPTTTTTAPTTTTTTEPPNTWTNLNPLGGPTSSFDRCSMAYDSTNDEVVFFGGWDGTATLIDNGITFGLLNETWVYDPAINNWISLSPAGDVPAARDGHSLVYDSAGGKVILFGGVDGTGNNHLNDTWACDLAVSTWTNLDPAGGSPSARSGHGMVYDSAGGKVILFGGYDGGNLLNDIWAYDPTANTWTKLSPTGDVPDARHSHSLVYDSADGKVILFGGDDGSNLLNDIWTYDPATNTWTDLGPSGDLPSARSGHGMAYDPASGKAILFGGYDGSYALNDAWAYDPTANTWTNLNPSGGLPPPRSGHGMVYDSASGKVVIFGGTGDSTLSDTWAYSP